MGILKVADIGTHFCSTVAKIPLNNQSFVGSCRGELVLK